MKIVNGKKMIIYRGFYPLEKKLGQVLVVLEQVM